MKHTSIQAYDQITASGRILTLKQKVYSLIKASPNVTQGVISDTLGESARKRVSELVKDGLIIENGEVEINKLHYIRYITTESPQMRLF